MCVCIRIRRVLTRTMRETREEAFLYTTMLWWRELCFWVRCSSAEFTWLLLSIMGRSEKVACSVFLASKQRMNLSYLTAFSSYATLYRTIFDRTHNPNSSLNSKSATRKTISLPSPMTTPTRKCASPCANINNGKILHIHI